MMKNNESNFWTMPFILVLLINAFNGIATFMVNPALPTYLVNKGIPFEYTGIVSSLLSWIALFFRPFSGAVSDRYNKKILMIASYIVVGVCMVLYAFLDDIVLLIILRLIHGVAFAISSTVSLAFATSFLPIERLGEGMGYLGLATLISNIVGPQFGVYINDFLGDSYVFLFAGLFIMIQVSIVFQLRQTEERVEEEKKNEKFQISNFFSSELLIYVFLIGILSFGNGIVSYYLKSFGDSRNIENVTLFFTINSLTLVFIRPFAGKIMDTKGIKYILYPTYPIAALSMAMLGVSYSLLPVLVASALKAISQGAGTPSIQTEAIRILGKERSGVAISNLYMGQDLGNAIGPIYASFMVTNFGYSQMFNGYAVMLLVSAIVFHFYNMYLKKRSK